MLNIPKVAQYARFSSDNQRSESIDAQIRAMNQYCKQNHWQVVAVYTDEAKSATTDNRPQFQQMISDSAKGEFDIVLVHKLDRFSRDRYDSAVYKKKLKKNNVKLFSVLEHIDDSPESIMMESVLEGMAEYYSHNLARETMKGMCETAYKCQWLGGTPAYGYCLDENRKLKIVPREAEAVKLIYEMYADGYGYSAITEELNKKGYRTRQGNLFKKTSLKSILENEKYIGNYIFNKAKPRKKNTQKCYSEIIRIEGGCPQIITKSLFDKVQRMKASNIRNNVRYHSDTFYLMTGKITCGICGKRMTGNTRYSGRNKTKLSTYRCPSHKIECRNKEINKDYLDSYVAVTIGEALLNPSKLRKTVNKINKYVEHFNKDFNDNYEALHNQFETISDSIKNITAAIEKGIITEDIVKRAEELENQRTQLESRMKSMKLLEPTDYKDVSCLYRQWKELPRNTHEYRSFIHQFVKEIIVRPYDLDVVLDIGLGVTTDLTETVSIRRGDLYELFDSKVRNDSKEPA